MKHVFNTDEVPHLWAHQTQDSARNAQGNLYFDGAVIYSYGSHFPMARIVEHKGKKAYLLTSARYSVTTSRHQSMVRQAIPKDALEFEVPHLGTNRYSSLTPDKITADGHKTNWTYFCDELTRLIGEAARAKSDFQRDWRLNRAIPELQESARKYAEFFGLRFTKLPQVPKDLEAYGKELRKESAAKAAEERKRKAEYLAQRLKDAAESIGKWRNGESVSLPYDIPCMLRIAGEEVQTSKGARVPLDHAKRVLPFVLELHTKGEEWKTNGHTIHLGNYSLDRIDSAGVHAGCHHIGWDEVERFAAMVGGAL